MKGGPRVTAGTRDITRRRALARLQDRLRTMREGPPEDVLGRLERNLAAQILLAEMQASLFTEQERLVRTLRALRRRSC